MSRFEVGILHLSSQRRYQERMWAACRCQVCGKPAITVNHCERHRQADNERDAKKRRAAGKPMIHCRACGDPGHNRRTCKKHLRDADGREQYNRQR